MNRRGKTSDHQVKKEAPVVNGNGSRSPTKYCHNLPQITVMGQNSKIAQSKASAKLERQSVGTTISDTSGTTTLHVDGTDKIIRVDVQMEVKIISESELANGMDALRKAEPEPITPKQGGRKKAKAKKQKRKTESSIVDVSVLSKTMSPKSAIDVEKEKSPQPKSAKSKKGKGKDDKKPMKDCPLIDTTSSPEQASNSSSPSTLVAPPSGERSKRVPKKKNLDFDSELPSLNKKVKTPKKVETITAVVKIVEKLPKQEVSSTDKPVRWLVGDMVWSKVSGHPWWPCMLSYDPLLSIYTRMSGNPRSLCRKYHVQYFGLHPERAWVSDGATMLFEGKVKFFEYAQERIDNCALKNPRTALVKSFEVKPKRKKLWDIAVKSAEDALLLSRCERKQQYTFQYEQIESVQTSTVVQKSGKQTSSTVTEEEKEDSSKQGKKRKRSGNPPPANSSISLSEDESVPKKKRQKVDNGCFDVFCQKTKDTIQTEHPEYDAEAIQNILQQQWCMMSQKQKQRYKSRMASGNEISDCAMMKSPQVAKPGNKKSCPEDDERPHTAIKRPKSMTSSASAQPPPAAVTSVLGPYTAEASSQPKDNGESKEGKNPVLVRMLKKRRPSKSSHDGSDSDTNSNSETQSERRVTTLHKPKILNVDEPDLEIFRLTDSAPKKEGVQLCRLCEKPGELIQCDGQCMGHFHPDCLGLKGIPPASFQCDECQTGVHVCFSCKQTGNDVKRCSVSMCGKFYHDACVRKLSSTRCENKSFVCPLHTCAACVAENPKAIKNSKGARLYKCVRCPMAYHVGDFCIAAGCEVIAGNNIVCSNHFKPIKSLAQHSHVNVPWCFHCSKGGTLLCCESCPASFHADCLNIEFPTGDWFCDDCVFGKKPQYGEIIWIKVGMYRWWPGEICHPRNVPTNIQEKKHQVGEFPVHFFGSHDYYWTHKGRVFQFMEGDKGSKDTCSKGLAKIFHEGVEEATKAYKLWKLVKESKEQKANAKNDKKPAPYKFVKTNIPLGSVQIFKADPQELQKCECRPNMENPCGPGSDCINRLLYFECNPIICPAADNCQNQRFQKREYPDSVSHRTNARGWGLKTNVDIKKGQFVNEYVGDLIDEAECKRRIKTAHDDNVSNFYMLTLDKHRIIDAGPKGNLSRFMNHSCQPNCETQKWTVNGDVRVGLFALENISAGSEVTFNYNLECLGNDKTVCVCGAPNCSGFLGVRPKTADAVARENKAKDQKKKKRKRKKFNVKKEHEDDCFRCGEGGELVMCDNSNCPKVYHLQCLNLTKPPHGKWACPWHHCDVCGKAAIRYCSECPNSFCANDVNENIYLINGEMFCTDHSDVLDKVDLKKCQVTADTPFSNTVLSPPQNGSVNEDSETETDASEVSVKKEPAKKRHNSSSTAPSLQKKKAGNGKKMFAKANLQEVVPDSSSDDDGHNLIIDIPV